VVDEGLRDVYVVDVGHDVYVVDVRAWKPNGCVMTCVCVMTHT